MINRVILVGNLTRDPELRYIPSGTAVTEIGLAINDRRKGANGEWIVWFPLQQLKDAWQKPLAW